MAKVKLTDRQYEKLTHALDLVHDVKIDVEETVESTGKGKRLYKELDDIVAMLYSLRVYR